ncbi:hypothetical protein [Phenylobacterium sp.]|uniref:hypothetical protein n=1 Tax=Phenylobacterium sp. TaxID=1871053 RepID=UPI0026392964|nr:hypothetical protein [Phenylobacterium sp.]
MLRRAFISALPLTLLAGPSLAAGAPPKEKAAGGQYVDISPVALPVVARDLVVNYVFVAVRLNLSQVANIQKLREREPFFRDALVRAGHRTPFTSKTDYLSLDVERLKAVMLKEAVRLGGKDIQSVSVMSQTAKRRTGVPKPPSA